MHPVRIVLDPHAGTPTYRQIVEQVRFLIAAGELAAGSPLPSTRALGLALGINPMTVSKAYGLLEADGLVEHRPGLPLTVRPLPADARETTRLLELRARLEAAAVVARQLGFSAESAAQLFRDILSDPAPPEDTP